MVMKAVRAELATEGRTDILAKVKAYRGGYSQKVTAYTRDILDPKLNFITGSKSNRARSLLRELTWDSRYKCTGAGSRHWHA